MDDLVQYAKDLWQRLGNVPVDESGLIEVGFLHFEPGTDRETIWHWFEDQFSVRVYDLMYHADQ